MLKDITLGQYFPGNSPVHKLDPRTKLVMLIASIIALFSAVSWISYGLCFVFLILVVAISRIPPKSLLRGMKPMIFILVFTGMLNLFFYAEGTVLLSFWGITVTTGGIIRAFFMVMRILMLVSATFMLTYTTSPIALTDGLEALLSPLKKPHLPVHELSMMMCIALRFIPTLIEETDKIISAQKARGADFESGKLMEKVKALVPILVPLFISAFRRADELATAMECRCYQGGEGRTKMKQMHYCGRDFCAFGVGAVLLAAVIALSVFGL